MKYRILNNNSLEFFDATANNTGLIAANGVNLKISANNGVIELGDTASDVQVGTVGTAINWTFLGGGTVGAGGTGVIAMGQSGDTVNMNVSGVNYLYPSNLVRYTDITATNNRINISTQVPGTINLTLPNRPVVGQLTLGDNVLSTSNATGSLTVAGGVGVSGNIYVGGTNAGVNGIYTDVLRYAANGLPWVMGSGGGGGGSFNGGTITTALNINVGTASVSNTTGSLIVNGGAGVSGNVYAGSLFANTGFQLGSAADGVTPIQGTFKWSGPNITPAWFGIYDSASARYYGISSSLPGSIASVGGYYSGMGISGTTSSAGSPIFGVLSNSQSGNGLGNVAFTIYGDSRVVTLRNTLDDNRGNANITGNLVVGNATTLISSTSNTTGSLIVNGGAGITGNVFLSAANNFSATTLGPSYRLGWTDNHFNRNSLYGGVEFNGTYLQSNSPFYTTGVLWVRNTIASDISNNTILFAPGSPVRVQNTAAAVSNSTGALIVNGGIGTSGAIYTTGGSITINNGLATTGNSGTIFLGDSSITKSWGSGWTFTSGITAPGFTVSGSGVIDLPNGSNTQPIVKNVGTNIGMYFPESAIGFAANGANGLFISAPTNGVNYVRVSGNTTNSDPTITAAGADANINLGLSPKGNGAVIIGPKNLATFNFTTGSNYVSLAALNSGATAEFVINSGPASGTSQVSLRTQNANQLVVSHTASAVNYVNTTGAATGVPPTISAQGSDTNIGIILASKGTGGVELRANGAASFSAGSSAGGPQVGYLRTLGSPSGGAVYTGVISTDTNMGHVWFTRGTGAHNFNTNDGGTTQFSVTHVASSVNYLQVSGAATGNRPSFSAVGSDANVGLNIYSKGTGETVFLNNGQVNFVVTPNSSTSANFIQVLNAATGGFPSFKVSSFSVDTNCNIGLISKGTGAINLMTNGGTNQLVVVDTSSAVNYLQVSGAATGGAPYVLANGSDTNIPLVLSSKGSGSILFKTAGTTPTQLAVSHTASAVNYVNITGAITSGLPAISAEGTDANVSLLLKSKATSNIVLQSNLGTYFQNLSGSSQLYVSSTSSAVNYVQITGSVTGSGPTLSSQGSDTNVNLNIQSKGTGNVNITGATANVTGNIVATGTVTAPTFISTTSFSVGSTSLIDISSNTFTTSGTTQVTIDAFPSTTYRSSKYVVQMTSNTSYHVIELTSIHDGANVWLSQYGEITTGSSLGAFDSSISSGSVNLLFTPTNSVTTVNLVRTSIVV